MEINQLSERVRLRLLGTNMTQKWPTIIRSRNLRNMSILWERRRIQGLEGEDRNVWSEGEQWIRSCNWSRGYEERWQWWWLKSESSLVLIALSSNQCTNTVYLFSLSIEPLVCLCIFLLWVVYMYMVYLNV